MQWNPNSYPQPFPMTDWTSALTIKSTTTTEEVPKWHDAQHQSAGTVLQLHKQHAPHVVPVMGLTAAATEADMAVDTARLLLTGVGVLTAAVLGLAGAAARSRGGRGLVRPSCTRLLKWCP